MLTHSSFRILNASAGSGKTFALVKSYLLILLSDQKTNHFRNILAITFTNKAVNEMKGRIINALFRFSDDSILKKEDPLFEKIRAESKLDEKTIIKRCRRIIKEILHDYGAYRVTTIDGFNQNLIRAFSNDLKLASDFDIEIDTDSVLSEAVDRLIAKAGADETLTRVLVDFAIEKADDDRSFDISYDFNKSAKLLVNENNHLPVDSIKGKSLQDFMSFKNALAERMGLLKSRLKTSGELFFELLNTNQIETRYFGWERIPKYFTKLIKGQLDINYQAKWVENIANDKLYTSKTPIEIAEKIEMLQPKIAELVGQCREDNNSYWFFYNIHRNIIPVSVLNLLNKEVENMKDEDNFILISDFNSIINKHLKEQPAAFIYERIGERYKHFFIDEFQDTSVKQWENLIPLIDNALSQGGTQALLVGDPKQAIYRWRGGRVEQFINLIEKKVNPFPVAASNEDLNENFRSHRDVVEFNNSLFKYISEKLFSESEYNQVYSGSKQNPKSTERGYVSLNFIESDDDAERKDDVYAANVMRRIEQCLEIGYEPGDICILTRKKKQGLAIANYLNEHSDVSIISSESLMLDNSVKVRFILNLLELIDSPQKTETRFKILNFLAHFLPGIDDKHDFINDRKDLEFNAFFKSFGKYEIVLDPLEVKRLPLYEICERLVAVFNLASRPDAYIQFLLDEVFLFSARKNSSILAFLDYFDKKKDKLSIVTPENQNAVTIMTIHKSKGLEFPVVIFPYADLELYREKDNSIWIDLEDQKMNDFRYVYANCNKKLAEYRGIGQNHYHSHREELKLDNINLLYVALTRAKEKLFIESSLPSNLSKIENSSTYSDIFIGFLMGTGKWDNSCTTYEFGDLKPKKTPTEQREREINSEFYFSRPGKEFKLEFATHAQLIWDSKVSDALERGNIIHALMSHVKHFEDVPYAVSRAHEDGLISLEQQAEFEDILNQIIYNDSLKAYFSDQNIEVYNEKDILLANGNIIRPDRVVISPDNIATVIDYKTGRPSESHDKQLNMYARALESLGLNVGRRILVYVNETIAVKEV